MLSSEPLDADERAACAAAADHELGGGGTSGTSSSICATIKLRSVAPSQEAVAGRLARSTRSLLSG